MRVVDIHAHCAFQQVAPIVAGTPLADADLGDNLLVGAAAYRRDGRRGIDIAALSVNRYWLVRSRSPAGPRHRANQRRGAREMVRRRS